MTYNNLSRNDTVAIEMMESLEYDTEQSKALDKIEEAIKEAYHLFDTDTLYAEIDNVISNIGKKRRVDNLAFPFDKIFNDLLGDKK
jgi:hypothetical protein